MYQFMVLYTLFEKLFIQSGGVKMLLYLSIMFVIDHKENVPLNNHKIVCD